MNDVLLSDFKDRRRQVRNYLSAVRSVERAAKIGAATRSVERRLLTLRAGTFLILYNLVEAATRGAIEAIHDQIVANNVEFGSLTLSLRTEVVRRFMRDASPSKNHTMRDFPSAFVAVALDQGVKLSGNVDARAIRELASLYGFSSETPGATRGGADLLTIKSNRNDLSHGLKTFEQIGRDYAFRELLAVALRSMSFMGDVLQNVSHYLDGEGYLE